MKRSGPPPRYKPLFANKGLRQTGGSRRERKPMRQRSAKKARADRERADVLDDLRDERGPWCEARLDGICTGPHTDGHEIVRRSQGGSTVDGDNILLVCRACHDWITTHPRRAVAAGLAKWSMRQEG